MSKRHDSDYGNSLFRHIPAIDGLRAVGFLAVFLYHVRPQLLPGGGASSDLFLVVSGYVVSASMARDRSFDFPQFAKRFYARRVLRILPALVVCLILSTLLHVMFIPWSWLAEPALTTAISAFFGVSNFILTWTVPYFSSRAEFNTFTHTWSLALEEQFYLLYPVIFYLWIARHEAKKIFRVLSIGLLPLLFGVSLFISWRQTSSSPNAAYYLLPSRFWEIAVGAMLFRLHAEGRCILESRRAQSIFGMIGIVEARSKN